MKKLQIAIDFSDTMMYNIEDIIGYYYGETVKLHKKQHFLPMPLTGDMCR